jgi:hypothetical protein
MKMLMMGFRQSKTKTKQWVNRKGIEQRQFENWQHS